MTITRNGIRTLGSFLLDHKKLYIPDYQREYSWEKDEQVDDFFSDMKDLVDNNSNHHFFGQIVLHKDQNGKVYIIDGQQRITTVMITLAVIRDLIQERGVGNHDVERIAKRIQERYIGEYEDKYLHIDELILVLGNKDRDYFKNNIQLSAPKDKGGTKSHKRIYKCYEFLKKELCDIVFINDKNNITLLIEYFQKLTENFELIFVETNDLDEAYIIFETLNARGKDLEISDLLKNYLFRESKGYIETVKKNWKETTGNLGQTIDITNYLRHFWNSRNPFTREKLLYRTLRKSLNKAHDVVKFSENFNELSPLYAALNDQNDDYFEEKHIKALIINLKIMKAKTFYPLILALVKKNFNNMDIKKVLQLIESFYFRNLITKSNPNKFEMFFAELAYGISKGTISNIDLVLKNIDENIIEDELFIQYFKNYVPKNRDISKHILREINDFYESEIQAICDNSSLNLEHIMPQNPRKKDWAMCSDEENYKLHINMIGNLTLLGEEYNKSISNKPFDEKKATYLNSKINITNKIAKWDDWTFETIHERQEELCKDALKRWPKLSF